jgi:NADPH:quinone reductase-like Zn-dependent oxidoreductase
LRREAADDAGRSVPLLESGQLTPIVARLFPLSEVRVAMKCNEDPRIVGRIIITP